MTSSKIFPAARDWSLYPRDRTAGKGAGQRRNETRPGSRKVKKAWAYLDG
jgi:hypothetical protein